MVEESVLNVSPVVANKREKLLSRVSLNKALEFLCQFRHEERNNSDNSCSFESITSSNIGRLLKSLSESTMFAELFLKLLHKN